MTTPIHHAHIPQIACIDDLFWCTCREPDWDTVPDLRQPKSEFAAWVAEQTFYDPRAFTAHVVEQVANIREAVS